MSVRQYSLIRVKPDDGSEPFLAIAERVYSEDISILSPGRREYQTVSTKNVEVVEETQHWCKVLKMGSFIHLLKPIESGTDIDGILTLLEELSVDHVAKTEDKYVYMSTLIEFGTKEGLITVREGQDVRYYLAKIELA